MKKSLVILLIAALCLAMSVAVCVYAATAGSESDPVVTKSYVDKVIADLKANGGGSSSGGGEGYVVIGPLSSGTVVVGGDSAEMILRSGAASAYIPTTAGGGISDLTGGLDIKNGKAIILNHLLLFPRDDGRAIRITKDNSYVMVKGEYSY